MIIGSGPIVIGQGCEFDYSGVQAVKALKGLGYEVVLVNSNPATVMTDPDRADRTYIEPLTADYLHEVIRRERPDALLPTLGGQTALNLAMELEKSGVLKRYRVELIGAKAEAIARAEDRNLFKEAMRALGLDMPRSGSAHSLAEAEAIARTIGSWPLIVRPGFTLGGTGGGIAHDAEEFARIVSGGLDASLNHEVLVEESLIGWKEYEMEVMRDKAGNAVIVCSIENMDPMGVHTGDSITVAPILTLTDREYQAMRDDSIRVLEQIGIETGGSNVQWAVNPKDGRRIIIEMNPRVSRSSALASKATGFPIAKIAALLAVGFTLDEIKNDITGKTLACFEPSLDYVVVKIPRFAFEKFHGANTTLGTQMKSVGEVMAIGRTFKQAYLKAVRSLEAPLKYHHAETYDPWFKRELEEIEAFREFLATKNAKSLEEPLLRQAKAFGFSDKEIAEAIGSDEITVRTKRIGLGIRPEFGEVDTCAGEFAAETPYYYSYYGWGRNGTAETNETSKTTGTDRTDELSRRSRTSQSSRPVDQKKKIMVLGGGPNRIGQGIEFDWCCCHAAFALQKRGYEVVMVNSNPETVSTDYDTSDKLYFEPLTFEDVMEIYDRENCAGVIVQYGGQTPLNLAEKLEQAGAKIVGTSPKDIALAEDRDFFRALVAEIGMKQPASGIAHSIEDARRIAAEIGYPVLVRPSFVLGGRGMAIVYKEAELDSYVAEAVAASEGKPILIDKFLEHAIELDVDAVSDGETTKIGAILEHIEAAGCHSGDAAAITPPVSLSDKTLAEVKRYTDIFAKRLHVVGLMNLQLAVKDEEIWMIEVNPRASRTVPFVSKATGIPLADLGALAMVGEKFKTGLTGLTGLQFSDHDPDNLVNPVKNKKYYCVKEAVFPYIKFPGAKITLSPEMKSTGEVMSIDYDRFGAYYKSQIACGSPLPKGGNVFLSVRDEDKPQVAELAATLKSLGFGIYATLGTSTYLWNRGVESKAAFRISRGRPSVIDLIRKGEINWVVNTSESDGEASGDSVQMRSCAVSAGVPVTTTLAGFAAAVAGLAEERAENAVYSLQEYHRQV